MKQRKTILMVNAIILMAVAIGYISKEKMQRINSPFFLDNIEALSYGEDGTPVGDCYKKADSYTQGSVILAEPCNDRTREDMIYPCENRQEFTSYSYKTKCTK